MKRLLPLFLLSLLAISPDSARAAAFALDYRAADVAPQGADSPLHPRAAGVALAAASLEDEEVVAAHFLPAASNPAVGMAALEVGDTIELSLFEDETLVVELVEKCPATPGDKSASFLGSLADTDGMANVVVVQTDEGLTLDVQDVVNGRVFTVYSSENGVRVTQLNPNVGERRCQTLAPDGPEAEEQIEESGEVANSAVAAAASTYVDMMVAYDTDAVSWISSQGTTLMAFANVCVQKMNTAIANNGLDSKFRFRLLGVYETGSSANGDLTDALYAAKNGSNGSVSGWSGVKTKRNALGADVVTVLVDTGSAYGTTGLGFSMKSATSSFSDSTYNACSIRAVNNSHTMTHEVGHNMGAGHATAVDSSQISPGPQLYSYSAGHYYTAGGVDYHTIMAYNFDGFGNTYTQAPLFSDPTHSYGGGVAGDSTHDNARTIANTFATVAAYRTAAASSPPSAPTGVSASDGTSASFVAISWTAVSDAISYTVYRHTSNSSGSALELASGIGGTSYNDTTAVAGTKYYYWVKAVNGAGSSAFSASDSGYRKTSPTLAAALDNTTLSFTTGGDASWFGQTDTTHDGTDAAQSGDINDSQSTWLQTTVSGAGTISFWWNVSSESSSYDYLEFLVDGTQNSKIGGTSVSWAQKTVTISGTGTHTLKWNYRKDSSYSSGSDCGWVDQVVWTPSATTPSAPTGVSATDGSSTANCTVSWTASSGATSYTVYRHTSNSSGSATTLKTGVTGTSYTDTSATPGTLYYYWVKAVNSSGTSGFSGSDSGYRKLSAPTISSATGSTTGVALSWGAVTGASYYRVSRATSSSGTKTDLGSWQTGTSYTDTSGTAGTTYYYFVRAAVNSSGTRPSAYSAYKTGAKTKVTAPSAPSGVSATDGTSTANCTVSWTASSGATSYTVYRHTSNSSGSATTLKTGVTGTSYADTTATPGTLFYYWVKAVNSTGTSGFSGSDSGYRKLSAPTISSATGSTTGVTLSWSASTGAMHYRVFRASSSTGSKTALGSWQTGRTYTDKSGTAGTTYYYYVQAAVNSSGERPSDYSAAKTGKKLKLPGTPGSVSATDGTSTASITVTWSAASDAASYTVYRATSDSSSSATVLKSGVTGTTYTDSSATPGAPYHYWVKAVNSAGASGFSASDTGYRKITNDAFASAIALSGYTGSVDWGTCGATAQSGEPLHADAANNSAWWTWTAPALGTVEISTAGSAFDTVLGVYTGTAVGSLTKVAANDDSGGASTSRVVFETAGAGTVYRIAVAGYDGASGALALSWRFESRNAATITGFSVKSASTLHVAFKARKGMTYKIQRASSLDGPWTSVATITPSSTGTIERDVTVPTSWNSGFVRVTVEE